MTPEQRYRLMLLQLEHRKALALLWAQSALAGINPFDSDPTNTYWSTPLGRAEMLAVAESHVYLIRGLEDNYSKNPQ